MYTEELTVINPTGLHARTASELVLFAQKYDSDVKGYINTKNTEVDFKSIVSILSAGMIQGTEFRLEVEGEDEETAGPEIAEFIKSLTD